MRPVFMFFLILPGIFLQLTLASVPPTADTAPLDSSSEEYMFYYQTLDHYEPRMQDDTFPQRFLLNDTYHKKDSAALFVFIGPESELPSSYISAESLPMMLAPKYDALVVSLEHRFYGYSVPCVDPNNCTLDELKFLSSQQALADLVEFINYIKAAFHMRADTKVIAFGGSYPGALSAYLRMKFPHIVDGAIASAAPVHNVPNGNWNYFLFGVGGKLCGLAIQNVFLKIDQYLTAPETRHELEALFPWWDTKTKPLDVLENQIAFVSTLAYEYYSYAAEFNYGIPFQFENSYPLDELCTDLKKVPLGNTLNVFANFCNATYNYRSKQNPVLFSNMRNWIYQASCLEWGLTILYDTRTGLFNPQLNPTADSGLATCEYYFGSGVVPHNNWTQAYYGTAFSEVGNIFFTYGQYDPVQTQGIDECYASDDTNVLVRTIEGTAHGSVLFPYVLHPEKPQDLVNAVDEIDNFIGDILNGGAPPHHSMEFLFPIVLSIAFGLFFVCCFLLVTQVLTLGMSSLLLRKAYTVKHYSPLNTR